MKKKTIIILLMAVVLAAMFFGTGCTEKKTADATPPPPPVVTVDRPVVREVTEYDYYTGTVEAGETVEIRARVEGYLESIHFEDGARVRKGDLLFVIDTKPFQARLDQAMADLQLSRAELNLARTTLARRENAFRDKAVSEVEVIEARARYDSADAAVKASEAAVATARLDYSYCLIHSPIDGRISRSFLDAGNLVGAGERTLLANIVADDTMNVYFTISETDLLRYRRGKVALPGSSTGKESISVYLGVGDDRAFSVAGRLDYMDNRIDAGRGTIGVRALFPNPGHDLLAGMFVHIRIPTAAPGPALLVPEHVLGADQQGSFLLVANDKDVVEYRAVTLGGKIDSSRIVKTGISADDRVIVNGIQRARFGIVVTPTEAAVQTTAKDKVPGESEKG